MTTNTTIVVLGTAVLFIAFIGVGMKIGNAIADRDVERQRWP